MKEAVDEFQLGSGGPPACEDERPDNNRNDEKFAAIP
jgi:hypothetical protein